MSVPEVVTKIRGNAETVGIHKVFRNPWNPNRMDDFTFDKTKHALETFAQSAPIVVREISLERAQEAGGDHTVFAAGGEGESERAYEIIDGEHRWRAAQELGWEEIAIWNLGDVDDASAKQLTIIFNELGGRADIDDLAILMQDIQNIIGHEALLANMPFHEQHIEDLLHTIDFDWTNYEAAEEEEGDGEKISLVRMEFRMDEKDAAIVNRCLLEAGSRGNYDHTTQEGMTRALLDIARYWYDATIRSA